MMKLAIQSKLFLSHFAAIILISGSVGTYFYHSAIESLMASLQARLQNSAALLSHGLDVKQLDTITQAKDTERSVYQDGVRQLRDFVAVNPDIAFIYVMRKTDDRVVFVLDSDEEEPALPGEVYPDVVPELLQGFETASVDEKITTDRWGSFLSGYSPLNVGENDYLVGIDMYADEVQAKLKRIRFTGLLSLSLSILLAVVFSRVLSRNVTSRIHSVVSGLSSIEPDHHVVDFNDNMKGDELDQLKETFEAMSMRIQHHHQQLLAKEAALVMAKHELENRVTERTAELVDANQQLELEVAERRKAESRLEKLSETDYLTGSLNRRALTVHLEQLADSVIEQKHSFCLILMDIDHFKQINDNYGHVVGDQLLQHVVNWFEHHLEEEQRLARWGGEEFLFLMPETSLPEAVNCAEQLCQSLAEKPLVSDQGEISVTASFGVSQFYVGESIDACIQRTDDALYKAKRTGRSRVVAQDRTTPSD